jgi:hypothetical protein
VTEKALFPVVFDLNSKIQVWLKLPPVGNLLGCGGQKNRAMFLTSPNEECAYFTKLECLILNQKNPFGAQLV